MASTTAVESTGPITPINRVPPVELACGNLRLSLLRAPHLDSNSVPVPIMTEIRERGQRLEHATLSLTPELALPLPEQLIAVRRELHHLAEPGWCEVRTASKVVQVLSSLGWTVRLGPDVIVENARMGVPPKDTL